jgi:hypothetical protein
MKKLLYFAIVLLFCLSIITCNPSDEIIVDKPVTDDTTVTWFKCCVDGEVWVAEQIIKCNFIDGDVYLSGKKGEKKITFLINSRFTEINFEGFNINLSSYSILKEETNLTLIDEISEIVSGNFDVIYLNNLNDTISVTGKFNKIHYINYCEPSFEITSENCTLVNKWKLHRLIMNDADSVINGCGDTILFSNLPYFPVCGTEPYIQFRLDENTEPQFLGNNKYVVFAFSGLNYLKGSYEVEENDSLKIQWGYATSLGGSDLNQYFDRLYFYNLQNIIDYQIINNELYIYSETAEFHFIK